MDSRISRKIIVAGGMAVVVGIAFVTFVRHSRSVTPVAQAPHPPTPVAQLPVASPAATAQIPPVPAAVAPIPDTPAAVTQVPVAAVADNDGVGTKSVDSPPSSALEPKLARKSRHLANADAAGGTTRGPITRAEPSVDTSEKPAPNGDDNSLASIKSVDQSTTPPSDRSPADDQKLGTSTEFAASDGQITADVKSEIAGDSFTKDVDIGVTTTHGVVVLSGKLPSQSAIDHVKDVVGRVKDVQSVDTSALILASL